MTEPGGFETVLTYDQATGQDLQKVERGNAAGRFLVASYTYNQHRPITFTGADGFTTSLTYNARGQTETVSSPDGNFTTITYVSAPGTQGYGKPQSVTRTYTGSGSRTLSQSFGYDAYDRIASLTDQNDQYTIGIQYDAVDGVPTHSLDRIARITYPDASSERVDYLLLDPADFFDRLGRHTHYERDPLRRVQSVTDPLGRTINYERLACCGSVDSLLDGNHHKTSWKYDVSERVIEKRIQDALVASYQYDPATGRLISITDALNQVKQFSYTASGEVSAIQYLNAVNATPNVSFAYDDPLGRMTQMTDGTGLTQYAYWPIAALGVSHGVRRQF
jgi:YD repeat-containing protein